MGSKEQSEPLGRYGMIGATEAMFKVYDFIKRVAPTDVPVYVFGETGTGKELVARALHTEGRNSMPYLGINAARFKGKGDALEVELFGTAGNTFTGVKKSNGIFVQGDNGTLFLDEISEIEGPVQARLLRVLQEREVVPVGGNYADPQTVDVRLVAAAKKPLVSYLEEGILREDFYYRLQGMVISLPPLRDRRSDIPLLADHFLTTYKEKMNKPNLTFAPDVMNWLAEQPWPGNIRQLEHEIESAVAWSQSGQVQLDDFPLYRVPVAPFNGNTSSKLTTWKEFTQAEGERRKEFLREALESHDWIVKHAAHSLGMHGNWLGQLVNKLGIKRSKKQRM